jgi:ABC-2 type transport system permease protein
VPTPASVLAHTLHERRRGFAGWGIGVATITGVIALYWPSVRDSADLQAFMRDLPEGMRALVGDGDYGTASGFLDAELFAFMVPLLFLIVAIGMGARAITREEERGTIDLLMATPITRRRMLLEKALGGVAFLAALGVVLLVALVLGNEVVDMGIPFARLAAISVAVVLLALPFGALALLLGCATGRHGLSLGLASTAAVGAYMLDALAPLVTSLEPYRDLSPFAWYASDEVLAGGLSGAHVALLSGVAIALTAVAVAALERRDLGT